MDSDKLEERRYDRRISPKRVRLADSLSANHLMLGAGVWLSMVSWGLLSSFAVAEEGSQIDSARPRQPTSEIRLKSMGSTIALTPIGKLSSVVAPAAAAQPYSSKIQINPLTGYSLETLDRPVFVGAHTENIRAIVVGSDVSHRDELGTTGKDHASLSTSTLAGRDAGPALASGAAGAKHPHILSIRRLDLQPFPETPLRPEQDAECEIAQKQPEAAPVTDLVGTAPPSILVQSLEEEMEPESIPESAIALNDAAGGTSDDRDDVGILPLLPLPTNRQWVAAASTGPEAEKKPKQRHNQRSSSSNDSRGSTANLPTPQTISVAQVQRLSTTHGGLSVHRGSTTVPARLSGFVVPANSTPQPTTDFTTPLDDVARMMNVIGARFPNAQLVLAKADGRLVVRGSCVDREEATAIIRLIRSHLLVPVDDQMVIR